MNPEPVAPTRSTAHTSLRLTLILGSAATLVGALTAGCIYRPAGPAPIATASYAEGVMAYDRGDTAAATAKLTAATQESPELIRARILLGDLFRAEGNYRGALEEYETVVKLDPYSPSSYYRLGLAYQFLQRFLEAKVSYEKALALKPEDVESQMNLGLVYLALGDLPSAMDHTKVATEIDPKNPDALANYGVVLDAVGDHVGAQRAFLSSLEISGDKPATLLNLSQNLLAQARAAEAQEVLQRFLKVSDSPFARKRLGDALALQGQAGQAIEQYEKALKLDPTFYPAMNEAGRVMIQRYRAGNELDETLRTTALGYWKNSLRANPTQPQTQALIKQWEKARP